MRTNRTKVMCILLTVAMLFSLMSTVASAADLTGDLGHKQDHLAMNSTPAPSGTVTVSVENHYSDCTVTGDGNYAVGDTVTLTATASEGAKFEYWLDTSIQFNGNPTEAELKTAIVSYDTTYTFTATKDVTLKATFSVPLETTIFPMLITGTDDQSLWDAEAINLENNFDTVILGAEKITFPGDRIEEIITYGNQQYKLTGFILFGYDEENDTEIVELRETLTIDVAPLYDSAEYWEYFSPFFDGIYAAYTEYTPSEENPTPPPGDPGTPQDPAEPQKPAEPTDPQKPADPKPPAGSEKPDSSKKPISPSTGDNNNLVLWIAFLVISGAGALMLVIHDRQKENY